MPNQSAPRVFWRVAYHPDPIPELKRQVADAIRVRMQGWRTADIACLIDTDQPRLSDIRRRKLQRFSLETLIRFATRLRCRVELRIADRLIER